MKRQHHFNCLQARPLGILLVWFCIMWSCTATSSQVITVKENYEGELPQRIGQIGTSVSKGTFAIASGAGKEFDIENTTGWLLAVKPFDREEKDVYQLQVMVTDAQRKVLDGPIAVQVQIADDNDHKPLFEKKIYEGSVRQKSRPGMPFIQVAATDKDQPNTTNTDLRFMISKQMPPLPADNLFQVDKFNGKISTSKEGYKLLDINEEAQYTLMLTVKDKGDHNLGNTDLTEVEITLLPNLWITPDPVEVIENDVPDSPILKIQWNDNSAHFELREIKHPHSNVFGINETSGEIFVYVPLDREWQDKHILLASARDEHGVLLDQPLEVSVIVKDANDNTPHFDHQMYCGVVQETAEPGTFVIKVTATDADDPTTPNADVRYSIVEQDPPLPKESMFSVDPISGRMTLSTAHVNRGEVNRYKLTVMARDMSGDEGGLNETCQVIVDVIDDNDHAPIFNVTEYGPVTISEDSPKGTKVMEIAAWDADEFGSKSWQVIFNVSDGDPDRIFNVSSNLKSNQGHLQLAKRLDFETKNEFNLTLTALNMVPLVEDARNGLSKAHIQVIVTDANDAPEFSKSVFLIAVLESVTIDSTLLKVTANDPDTKQHDPVRYSLDGDRFNWFTIDNNGVIKVAKHLDREKSGPMYSMRVIAADGANGLLTSEAEVNVTILDVNDNAPKVLEDTSTHRSLCHKRRDGQAVTLKAQDADGMNNSFPFTFHLMSQDHVWVIKKHNHSHAKLSLNASEVAEGEHVVVVVISDSGKPTQRSENPIKVYACQCDEEGECIYSSQQLSGGEIAGICIGVLLGIGAIVAVVVLCMNSKKQKKKQHTYETGEFKDQPHDEVPLKAVDEGKNDVPASPYAVEMHPE